MKSKVVILAFTMLACISGTLRAQSLHKTSSEILPKNIQMLRGALSKSVSLKNLMRVDEYAATFPRPASKTTSITRLTSMSFYGNDGTNWYPTDSTALVYSGSNSGEIGYPMLFDESIKYSYDLAASKYDYSNRERQTIVNGKIAEQYLQDWNGQNWADVYRYLIAYTTTGNIAEIREAKQNNGAWDDTYWSTFVYNGNTLQSIEVKVWDVNTNQWEMYYREIYMIVNNRVVGIETQTYQGSTGSWIPYDRFAYSYDTKGALISLEYTLYDMANQVWENNLYETYSYDQQGNPVKVAQAMWDKNLAQYVNSGLAIGAFNMYNQPSLITTYTWGVNGWENTKDDIQYALHYQMGDGKGTGIAAAELKLTNLQVYPNPASTSINVSFNSDKMQLLQISLYDMFGKQIRTTKINAVKGTVSELIDVQGLSAGMYQIAISGDKNEIVTKVEIK